MEYIDKEFAVVLAEWHEHVERFNNLEKTAGIGDTINGWLKSVGDWWNGMPEEQRSRLTWMLGSVVGLGGLGGLLGGGRGAAGGALAGLLGYFAPDVFKFFQSNNKGTPTGGTHISNEVPTRSNAAGVGNSNKLPTVNKSQQTAEEAADELLPPGQPKAGNPPTAPKMPGETDTGGNGAPIPTRTPPPIPNRLPVQNKVDNLIREANALPPTQQQAPTTPVNNPQAQVEKPNLSAHIAGTDRRPEAPNGPTPPTGSKAPVGAPPAPTSQPKMTGAEFDAAMARELPQDTIDRLKRDEKSRLDEDYKQLFPYGGSKKPNLPVNPMDMPEDQFIDYLASSYKGRPKAPTMPPAPAPQPSSPVIPPEARPNTMAIKTAPVNIPNIEINKGTQAAPKLSPSARQFKAYERMPAPNGGNQMTQNRPLKFNTSIPKTSSEIMERWARTGEPPVVEKQAEEQDTLAQRYLLQHILEIDIKRREFNHG